MKKTVFDCQMCGQCCEGEGGIVLSPKDLKRLYEGLNLEKQAPEREMASADGRRRQLYFFPGRTKLYRPCHQARCLPGMAVFPGEHGRCRKPPSGQGVLPRYTP